MSIFYQIAIAQFAGYYERQSDSTHAVSMWNIPNMTHYSEAHIVYVFFNCQKNAEDFANHWDNPPEMAIVMPISEYDEIQRKVEQYKKDKLLREEMYYFEDELI